MLNNLKFELLDRYTYFLAGFSDIAHCFNSWKKYILLSNNYHFWFEFDMIWSMWNEGYPVWECSRQELNSIKYNPVDNGSVIHLEKVVLECYVDEANMYI